MLMEHSGDVDGHNYNGQSVDDLREINELVYKIETA